jgi:hypothetical protein
MTEPNEEAASRVQIVETTIEDLRDLPASAKRFADAVRRLRFDGFDQRGPIVLRATIVRDDTISDIQRIATDIEYGPAADLPSVPGGTLHLAN